MWDELFKYDQLNIENNPQGPLRYFKEGKLQFAPTYKYDPGTDVYDTSEKGRIPAWCDRILWKGSDVTLVVLFLLFLFFFLFLVSFSFLFSLIN